jgi:hypothetical protein
VRPQVLREYASRRSLAASTLDISAVSCVVVSNWTIVSGFFGSIFAAALLIFTTSVRSTFRSFFTAVGLAAISLSSAVSAVFSDWRSSAGRSTQPALAGGCLYSERFTIPQGQNSYDLDLPIPTITAPIRIGFMQNRGPSVADPDPRWPDFQIPLSLRTFDRVRNPDRGSSTEVLAVETSGRGNVLPTWYRVVFPTNAAVGFGNDEEVFTNVIQPSSHNTIHVRARQGVGVGPNATMSYRIRVIGGTCGGNAQNP